LFNPKNGKLHAIIKSPDEQEYNIPAESIKKEFPLHLAQHIGNHPVERSHSGHWNTWARAVVTSTEYQGT
jgi:hypothetical protein